MVINGSTFCSFEKKICVDYTAPVAAENIEKYKAELNANKDLRYDDKTQTWINAAKKFAWKITKVSETDYELNCKKLQLPKLRSQITAIKKGHLLVALSINISSNKTTAQAYQALR